MSVQDTDDGAKIDDEDEFYFRVRIKTIFFERAQRGATRELNSYLKAVV